MVLNIYLSCIQNEIRFFFSIFYNRVFKSEYDIFTAYRQKQLSLERLRFISTFFNSCRVHFFNTFLKSKTKLYKFPSQPLILIVVVCWLQPNRIHFVYMFDIPDRMSTAMDIQLPQHPRLARKCGNSRSEHDLEYELPLQVDNCKLVRALVLQLLSYGQLLLSLDYVGQFLDFCKSSLIKLSIERKGAKID